MSGITNNTSVDYQQQLALLNQSLESTQSEVDKLKAQNPGIVNAFTAAQARVQETVDWYNNQNFTDLNGNRLHFDTLKEWDDKCKAGGVIWDGKLVNNGNGFLFPVTQDVLKQMSTAQADYDRVMGPTLAKLKEAQTKMDIIGAGLKDNLDSLNAMAKMLESGDIEGAVMMLQTSRAKTLEKQLSTRIEGMSARNAAIRAKNDDMALKQGELAGLTGDNQKAAYASKQKEITKIKGEIDQLNSDSSLDMIGIQTLVNKRNEAFDTLTNLMGKFQKTIDGIVGNMR